MSSSMVGMPANVTYGDANCTIVPRHSEMYNCAYFDGRAKAMAATAMKPSMRDTTWTP
jgi:prepilin-type processing-associated H-X9-DG protein